MLKLIIEDDEGRKTVVPFVREEITIGRQEGNTIRLTERNVSRRHARLLRQNGHVVVEDLGSSNGTRINGERISGQSSVKDGDLIQIGDYDLALQSEAAAAAARSRPAPSAKDEPTDPDASASEPETELETPVQEEEAANASASGDQRRHSTAIIRMDQVENTRSRKVQDLDPEEAPRLVVLSSEFKGQEFACIRTEMRIGRTEDNDIVIDHRSLSRTHAKVVREDNGEWRVIDMQSANGLTVNGESYAQASLNNGDTIELGHVKLRFVSAGEAAGALDSGGRSKLPLVLVLLLLVVGGGGAAAFFLLKKPAAPGPTPPSQVTQNEAPPPAQAPPEQAPPEQAPPEENPEPQQAAEPTPPEPTPAEPKPDPAEQAGQKLAALVQEAEQALAAGNLEKAEDTLRKTQQNGKLPPEAQAVAEALEVEKQASKALKAAQAALKSKNFDEVDRQLALSEGTTVFAKGREELVAALDKARAATEPQPKVEPKPKTPPAPPNLGPSSAEQARAAYDDAHKLFRAKQYGEALHVANKCVELEPSNADCHLLLGATYAKMPGKLEQGANHYRKFLTLVPPDNERAVKVRELLDNYEKSKNNPSN